MTAENFPIYIALLSAALACVAYLVSGVAAKAARPQFEQAGRVLYYVSLAAVAYASLTLLQMLLSGDRHDIAYVHDNSGPGDSVFYRVTSFWAGQEGSLLFWALVGALVGLGFVARSGRNTPFLNSFWSSVQAFFLVLLVAQDPFRKAAADAGAGVGLNPLLKNPWMAIHPPVVFIGYVLLSVPAALAIHALIQGDFRRWAARCLPWAVAGWASLSAGLALGMIWSYEVLGWGGYWGWDPVENASLVPWLTSTALVHGLLLQRARGRMAPTNVVLSLATFVLVIYATFLTRSGALGEEASVHAFTQGPYAWLLGFLVFYTVLSIVLTAARWRQIPAPAAPARAGAKDLVLALGVAAVVLFAVLVLAATSYPLFARGSVDAAWYNTRTLPIAIAIAVLIALAPVLRWSDADKAREQAGRGVRGVAGALMLVAGVVLVGGILAIVMPGPMGGLFSWLLASSGSNAGLLAQPLLLLLGVSLVALAISAVRCFRTRPTRAGAYIAHAGVALMLVGIAFSCAGVTRKLSLVAGGPAASAFGYTFSYHGQKPAGRDRELIHLTGKKHGRSFDASMLVQYSIRGAVRSPRIHTYPFSDLYISPKDQGLSPTGEWSATVTPSVGMGESGLVPTPVKVPGTGITLQLDGMNVEQRAARLGYTMHGHKHTLDVAVGRPAGTGGYLFAFKRFVTSGSSGAHGSVGVEIEVQKAAETAIIEVSRKPLVSLVWLGCVLILLGGVLAFVRRRAEAAKLDDGILPDSSGTGKPQVPGGGRRRGGASKGHGAG